MIKKLMIKLFLFMVVLACAAPFLMKDKDGRPLMTIDRIRMPQFSMPDIDLFFWEKKAPISTQKTENLSPDIIVPGDGQKVVKMFTYKDEKGIVHFTDQEPMREDYQVIYYPVSEDEPKGSLDRIKEKISNLAKQKDATPSSETMEKKEPDSSLSLPASLQEARQALDDAKALKQQVEDTYQKREQMMNEERH